MKITLFIPSIETGGVERNLVIVANHLVGQGCSVEILYLHINATTKNELDHAIKLTRIARAPDKKGIFQSRIFDGLFMFPGTVKHLLKNRDTTVLSFQSNIISLIAAAITRTPIVVRISNHPSVVKYEKGITRRIAEFLKPIVYRLASAIVTNSKSCSQAFINLNVPIHTIYNPIDICKIQQLALEDPDEPWLNNQRAPTLVAVGRLCHQKGFDSLIKAIAILLQSMEVNLIIVGEGDKRNELQNLANQLNISEHVKLIGFKSNVYQYVSRADLFVLSSRYEGMPNALLEASALGVKVVSTNCDSGPSELIRSKAQGELVPIDNPNFMAEAIKRQLKNSELINTSELFAEYKSESVLAKYKKLLESISKNAGKQIS